ncbi:23279_t:CDS:2 [Cetraspora pellucida]|uniref:23279_t:CDS:1 n=1 Tax=Cetraspora pellucida TaxID=1433469 RepID=A0A9N8W6E4_9GLOM|nr:23279_t:CDS:2 [Cetraspora pellucida]
MVNSIQKRKKDKPQNEVIDDIPEEEKLRLIKSTGLFNTLKGAERERSEQIDQDDPTNYGFTFQAFIYTIPLCAVYSMMDILVHKQYNQDVAFIPFSTRVIKISPSSILCGCHLIWVINKANYYGVMRRCPSLATLWVYFVVQLRLVPAALSLNSFYRISTEKGFLEVINQLHE